ncbi:hypothetical protein Bca52824_073427 [Brassica carinata]|uniref:F-box domain-containing protein n=1 Tax=Brassica carinata TaxID=52824 RepID=A0A8X7QAK5_BRACI|nr:hypothetical protein Bca52824_073427 [Brassica carinata]
MFNSMDLGRGIPRRCDCGAVTVVLMLNTTRNPGGRFYRCGAILDYFLILELPEEIQALVVEHVAGNSFQDFYGLRASCKLMKVLEDRRSVCHFYDVLSVPCGLNMPAELFKT